MLKIFFKKIVKFILVKLNLIRLFLLFAPRGRLVILNYHRISDKKSEKSLSRFDRFFRKPESPKASWLEKFDHFLFKVMPPLRALGGIIVIQLWKE